MKINLLLKMSYHFIFDIAERKIGEIRTIMNNFVDCQSDQASNTCVQHVTRVKKPFLQQPVTTRLADERCSEIDDYSNKQTEFHKLIQLKRKPLQSAIIKVNVEQTERLAVYYFFRLVHVLCCCLFWSIILCLVER